MNRWVPHNAKGRKIVRGQMIHVSVAFCPPDYLPQAKPPPSDDPWAWKDIIAGTEEFVLKVRDKKTPSTLLIDLDNYGGAMIQV
jgi:hypothetical protein